MLSYKVQKKYKEKKNLFEYIYSDFILNKIKCNLTKSVIFIYDKFFWKIIREDCEKLKLDSKN